MFCFRSNPSIFLLSFSVFLFISSSFGNSHSQVHHTLRIPDVFAERENDGVVVWNTRRSIAEESAMNSSLLLAEQRTHRKDPLDNFKRYTGGWNISNQHYWASVGYTAAPFFVIAVVCVGCIILYTGQGKFHSSTTNTLNYVVDQADTIAENLKNVSGYLAAAKGVGVDSIFLPSDVQKNIDNIEKKINSSATTLSKTTSDNSKGIQDVLDSVRLALIIVAAVMLFLAFLGFLFSILGMQPLVYFLVMIGWFLVTGTFILCGVFLLLHNVTADTCVAMDDWVKNPTAHTALDDILPCVDNATAQETLTQSKNVTYQLVIVVDGMINNISNKNYPPVVKAFYFNQSGPLMPVLCNPFHPDLTDRPCATGEVQLNNATEVWKKYVCQVSAAGICTTTGRVTPTYYNQMAAAVNVSYGLYRYAPFLVNLQDCTFARSTFTDINNDHCPGLRKFSGWIYIGLVMVSVAVMCSLIFWVIYARERRHRVYTKRARSSDVEGKATS
uniref:Uncharacterized protein n=1 Tax=Fagus sylvatica TaxID=28930 RepID=A0A2N9FVY0_FAGSY